MPDAHWAARQGDALAHSSVMADVFGGALEVVATVAAGAAVTAAVVAAAGVTVATGGLGACVLGAVVGAAVTVGMELTGADDALSTFCHDLAGDLFPPTVCAYITSGSPDVFINGLPAARAAGSIAQSPVELPDDEAPEGTFLDIAKGFFSELWRPTVATPDPRAMPQPLDRILCDKHPGMPGQYLAEGSSTVFINGQPAVRSGDRSACDAVVVASGSISPNVRIGGGKAVVRTIRSGKTPGVGLAISALLMLRGGPAKFVSNLPCLLLGGASAYVAGAVGGALARAVSGSPNPVHAATGAKVLGGDEDLDFVLPGVLPIEWQRFYSSRDERPDGLFGVGWSVPFEVCVRIDRLAEGGERLIYIDEQARHIDMGSIAPGSAVFSAGEGLTVKRHTDGRVLIESEEGTYRLFEPTLLGAPCLRLSQLGDRNDNRIHLIYDAEGRLCRLHDTLDVVRVALVYSALWPRRVERIERLFDDDTAETMARYTYDDSGQLTEVYDALGKLQRQFAYHLSLRMAEHRLPTGLRCFYEWTLIDEREWRVVRHWTDDGSEYRFEYDLTAGITTVVDGLNRRSTRCWNAQHQITEYTDNLGHLWQFSWNDERQLCGAIDPDGGTWTFAYDEAGNLCSTEDPLGRIDSTLWLEHWSLPKVETDAAGNGWQYRYDARGNRTHEVDPLGHVTRYRFDERGRVVEVIDATGNGRTLSWDAFGQLTTDTDCSGYSARFTYDRRGFLQRSFDAKGEQVDYQHDALGRLSQREGPEKRVERFLHDDSGLLVGYVSAAEEITRYAYDPRGRLCQRTDPHHRKVEASYDPYDRLQTLTNENGESYRFGWDAADRLSVQQNLDGSQWRYQYDALGNAIYADQLAGNEAIVHRFERDAVGRLIAKVTDDGRTVYDYDLLDNLIGITFTGLGGERQVVSFTYDALGQMISETTSSGTLNHRYDELGNLTQTQLPDGRWLNRLYYGSGHLHQINLDGHVISDFERDRLHREVLRTQGQHETRSEYDRHRRLSARERMGRRAFAELPVRSVRTYEYDLTDNLIARVHSLSPGEHRTQLGYDSTHRVTLAQSNMNGLVERFAYDPAANLLSGPQTPGRHVVHNKLLNFQDKHYRYDSFGRLSEKRSDRRGRQRFAYDAESRLIEVRNPEGHVIRMTYDPLGRRVGKTLYHPDGHILCDTTFAWDGLRLLREEQNGFPTLYLYADHGYEPLARIDGRDDQQRIRYYHNDSSGVPEQLTEADGYLIWQTRYEVWGNTVGEDRERYFVENQNLRFQGQYLDRETGLHYNTFRYYDPDIGRFTTPDPIGLAGGLNLYQYAPNPIGWVDPWGWSCTPNKKSSYQGASRRDAFRQARLDAGVPLSQQPYAVSKPYLEDGYGGYVYKDYKKIQTRSYHFMTNDGKKLIIQDHSYGHVKAMPKHGAEPHFNVRPIDKPQNGSVEGTYGHYNH
ncbi:RHS repeat-associated core domain-containing protein [Pseudomonas sp. NPDC088444]|uniref:RHS repeat-associated core domain-containing protein n=1 Tax=Pseudomonas sp. NPDC088444 TaxID=3364456 RepID=UPI00384E223B